jgi:hypothetical protein
MTAEPVGHHDMARLVLGVDVERGADAGKYHAAGAG